jgi:hypothetical protein
VLEERAADLLGGDEKATGSRMLGFRLRHGCAGRSRGAEQHRDPDRTSDEGDRARCTPSVGGARASHAREGITRAGA